MEDGYTKRKFGKVIGIVTLIICAIFCGKILGDYIVHSYIGSTGTAYTESELIDNNDAIISSYKSGKIQLSNIKTDADCAKALAIAVYNFNNSKYAFVTSTGDIENSIASQIVYGTYLKENNISTSTELSSGVKKVANKVVYDRTKDEVKVYKGKVNSDKKSGTYDTDYKTYTNKSYKEYTGVGADAFFAHIISSKTIFTSTISQTSTGIKIVLELDPEKATINFAQQIAVNGDLAKPRFSKSTFTFEIDKNFTLQSFIAKDTYAVNYGVTVTCVSTISATISYKKGN